MCYHPVPLKLHILFKGNSIHVEIPQWLNHYMEAAFGSELDLKMQVGGGVRVRGLGGVGWWC